MYHDRPGRAYRDPSRSRRRAQAPFRAAKPVSTGTVELLMTGTVMLHNHFMKTLAVVAGLALTGIAAPCTIFLVARSGQVLMGANEDMTTEDAYSKHWVAFHAKDARNPLGYITLGYAAIPFAAQAGMNEAGLFYDYNALPKLDENNGKTKADIFLGERILAECKTVAEAVKKIQAYDWAALTTGQMVIGDATGASAIVERNAITYRGKADYQIGTNFRTSKTPKAEITCWRYKMCDAVFNVNRPVNIEVVRQSLIMTMPKVAGTRTWYSNIADLKNGKLLLFRKGDFTRVVTLDVKTEVAKESRRIDMDELMTGKAVAYR